MTISKGQSDKAARFAALHQQGCFILPNAWDMASAVLIVDAGFPAAATTSCGVAFANGLPDGEKIGRERMLAVSGEIARRLPIPVTADLEAGYGPEPDDVAVTVRAAIAAGAVGCNIEDADPRTGALFGYDVSVARVRAGVEAARQAGLPDFVLNARTDPFFTRFGDAEACLAESVRRANAYLEVGARSTFVPGPNDPAVIRRLAEAIHGPLNIMSTAAGAAPPLATLAPLGVRRISLGGAWMLDAYDAAGQALHALSGREGAAETVGYGKLTRLLTQYA